VNPHVFPSPSRQWNSMNGQQFFLVARVLPLESSFPVRHLRESRIDSQSRYGRIIDTASKVRTDTCRYVYLED